MPAKKIFLATTAIEEFWDTSGSLVFLGEWCKRYSRREYLRSLGAATMGPPYRDERVPEIFRYLGGVQARALALLSKSLNEVHGVDHGERYWRILVGTWLLHFIHVIYDRYTLIRLALASYPELTTLCLDEACFQTPGETVEFMDLAKGDIYNLQIFSRIMGKLNMSFPKRSIDCGRYSEVSLHKVVPGGAASFTKKVLAGFLASRGKGKIFYHNAYLPRAAEIGLLLKTGFAISRFFYPPIDLTIETLDQRMRSRIKTVAFGEDEFEGMLFDLISEEIPIVFVEKYKETNATVHEMYRHKPAALMSASSWHYIDVFKLWAASQAEKGVPLVGLQHGGNYGFIEYFLQEEQELSVVDRFYSWGWTRPSADVPIVPLTPTKFLGRERKRTGGRSTDILYDLATWSRYVTQFPLTREYWDRYFRDVDIFAGTLSELVRSNLRLRPHREDMGWEVTERLKDAFPGNTRIETWDVPFAESLDNCCLFLCGTPTYSTTFIEALHIDKPTILFYRPSFAANILHADAVEYFEDLRSAGILFGDPIEAAGQVNEVYGHVDEWWNESGRQAVVKKFTARFAMVSANAMDEWARELNGIVAGSRGGGARTC